MSELNPPLNSELVESIRFVVHSRAWEDYYAPLLETVKDSCTQQILDPSQERKDKLPDDFLRGWICALNGLLNWGPQLVAEYDAQSATETTAHEDERRYEERAAVGSFGPLD